MSRKLRSSLRKLLRTRDHAAIRQGVELAVSLGDPDIPDALLDGVVYDPSAPVEVSVSRHRRESMGEGRLRPNATFSGSGLDRPYLEQALLALISRAPGPRAAALREQITVVILDAGELSAPVVDLAVLEGLPRLHTLKVIARGIVGGASLGTLPALRELELHAAKRLGIDRLDGLSKAAHLERVLLKSRVGDLSGLAGCKASHLELHDDNCRDLTPVGRMPRLRELVLDVDADYAGLSGSPLRSLRNRGESRTFAGAGELPNLEEIHIRGTVEGLNAPALQTLRCDSLRDAPPLPRLRYACVDALEDDAVPALANLSALEELHVLNLSLSRWGDLARLPVLRSLTYARATHLVSTEGVPPIEVKHAWPDPTDRDRLIDAEPVVVLKHAGESLQSLADIHRLPGMRGLSLEGCSRLTTLDGLQGANDLRSLDLRGCVRLMDSSALAGLDLHLIEVTDCPHALEGGLPDEVAGAARPKRRQKKVEIDQDAWARLVALAGQNTHPSADQAADLAREIGSPAYERLLSRASWIERAGELRATGIPIRGNTPAKQHLLRRLVAEAPGGCAVAARLRERITRLQLEGLTKSKRGVHSHTTPIDLRPLIAFPNLEEVIVRNAEPLIGLETLATHPRLRRLSIKFYYAEELPDLRPLAGSRVRELDGPFASIQGADALPEIERLNSQTRIIWCDIGPVETLRELRVINPPSGEALARMRLTSLEAYASDGIDGWRSETLERLVLKVAASSNLACDLTGLTRLRELEVNVWDPLIRSAAERPQPRLGPLPVSLERLDAPATSLAFASPQAHTALHTLATDGCSPEIVALLRELPALRTLRLANGPNLRLAALLDLPITRLDLRSLDGIIDPESLEAHPTLERVHVELGDDARLPSRFREEAR